MECNKDEALRAKEIAEKKFMERDVAGARKFAIKAQNLFPALEGIDQMIATLDVNLTGELKINGEKNWYAILSVHHSVDDDTLKKQYRKLALQFHPDKNKSVGAEGAFQLISEAWSVLSDRDKRLLYNQKTNVKEIQQKPVQPARDHSAPKAAANGFYNFTSKAAPRTSAPKSTGGVSASTFAQSSAPKKRAPKSTASVSPSIFAPSSAPMPRPPKSTSGVSPSTIIPPSTAPPPHSAPAAPTVPPRPTASSPSNPSTSMTFWTACHSCHMQYEYLRIYVNHNLLCPKCKVSFLAVETSHPTKKLDSPFQWATSPPHLNLNQNTTNKNAYVSEGMPFSGSQHIPNLNRYTNSNIQSGSFSQTAGTGSVSASSTADAQAANVVHLTYEKVRKEHEEAQAAARMEFALRSKFNASKRKHGIFQTLNADPWGNQADREHNSFAKVERLPKKRRGVNIGADFRSVGVEQEVTGVGVGMNTLFGSTTNGPFADSYKPRVADRKPNISRVLLQFDIKNQLKEKAKATVSNKLGEWKAAAELKTSGEKEDKKKQKHKETGKHEVSTDHDIRDDSKSISEKATAKDSSNDYDTEADNAERVVMHVPDPDFHDFDKDRTEVCFEGEQVWATYDDEDGMPRYYVLIQKVISIKPFKIRVSFLSSKSNSELGPIIWVASGFSKTCGEFRLGKYDVIDTVNIFSHRVRWDKGPRGIIMIYPRKGDVWALYRNWSPDWDEHTPDDIMYKYDMVEVLEDYDEQGVLVTPLLKVACFRSVFHRHLDPKKVKKIPREEMFRFSHQVPSVVLTGEEAHNAPKSCYELDPAATPLELLQVMTEAKDDEVIQISEHEPVSRFQVTKVQLTL